MKEAIAKKRFMFHFFALDKPWLYLIAVCYLTTMTLVLVGNPLLPLELLANDGWAWHHIPEILAFLFFGIYLANLGYLSRENLNYLDSSTLILVTVVCLAYAAVISYNQMFRIVLTIAFIPSFTGFFLTRFCSIRKNRNTSR